MSTPKQHRKNLLHERAIQQQLGEPLGNLTHYRQRGTLPKRRYYVLYYLRRARLAVTSYFARKASRTALRWEFPPGYKSRLLAHDQVEENKQSAPPWLTELESNRG